MTKILASAFLVSLLAACSSMSSGYGSMNHTSAAPMGMMTQDTMRNGDGPN